MTADSTPARIHTSMMVMVIAIAVSAAALRNGFTYDDIPMIVENGRVTTLSPPWVYFGQSYWPGGGLYRPLTVWLLALEWQLSGGGAWLFHAVNILLHAAVTVLVYRLALRALPSPWAGLAALLFAVHPVHVEAVANVVGVSELLCAGFVLAAVLLGLRGVSGGFTPGLRLGTIALGMLAAISKEQGFMTPVLLLAGAGVLGAPPAMTSLRRAAPVALGLLLMLVALLLTRAAVLGSLTGQDPFVPLQAAAPSARAWIALGTVPEWGRLLFWPARLSFDYSPPGHGVAATPGIAHVVAAAILAAGAWLAWACRRNAAAVTLGFLWIVISLVPVSNLLMPTGILLAERTLYLPSVGAVLMVAGLAELGWRALAPRPARWLVPVSLGALLVAGAVRSVSRAAVWRSNDALMATVDVDAPDNYRAHRIRGMELDRQGHVDRAEAEYRRSIALWGRDARVYEDLAILLHRQGRIAEAARVLDTGLQVAPSAPVMRGKLFYLQAAAGDWPEARATAAAGMAQGDTMFAALVRSADSALAISSSSPDTATR